MFCDSVTCFALYHFSGGLIKRWVPSLPKDEDMKKAKHQHGIAQTRTAAEAFTDVDLNQFIRDKKTDEIVERLKRDNDFNALVNAIKEMDSEKRMDLLHRASKAYRNSWSELHLNPETASADELRKGQTVAGMKAEKLIAETVVDLVRKDLG